jgi:hypothetical protein
LKAFIVPAICASPFRLPTIVSTKVWPAHHSFNEGGQHLLLWTMFIDFVSSQDLIVYSTVEADSL